MVNTFGTILGYPFLGTHVLVHFLVQFLSSLWVFAAQNWLWVKTNGIPCWGRCTTRFLRLKTAGGFSLSTAKAESPK